MHRHRPEHGIRFIRLIFAPAERTETDSGITIIPEIGGKTGSGHHSGTGAATGIPTGRRAGLPSR